MTINDYTNNSDVALSAQYRDHTVQNPVNSLKYEDLPFNAYSVHNQSIRQLHITIQVLDEKTHRVIETITGKAESGDINVSSTSMMRREARIKLGIDPNLFPSPESLIWFNKICRVYIGIEDNSQKDEIVNFLAGTYWVESVNYMISDEQHVLDVALKDKMMKWIDMQLEYPLVINTGTPIDVAIKTFMEHIGETDFGDFAQTLESEIVPYTINYAVGEDVIDLITELRDMYMDYVCGYNVAGEFEFKKIEVQAIHLIDEPKWRFDAQDNTLKTLISFDTNYNLRNIKNRVVVYGGTSTYSGITPKAESRITDSSSPFNVNAIGERTKIIVEDKFVLNEQCQALARYESYKSSNFQEEASISTVPIYLLDVYDIIDVIHPYTRIEEKYIIDNISFGLAVDSTMLIEAHKLYFVSLDYGEEDKPLVDYIISGIQGYGWMRLSEQLVERAYGMQGSGEATVNVTFVDNMLGGFQASATSYPTTINQSLEFDLADFQEVDFNSRLGGYIPESRRDNDDSLSRLVAHETYHLVMNDYLGHEKAVNVPLWFREGMAELLHGSIQGRFESVFLGKSSTERKAEIIKLAEWILDGNFDGTSEDYVASYMIAWAIYKIAKRNNIWHNLHYRLQQESNLAFNFLSKVLPLGGDTSVKNMIINELKNGMTDIWEYGFRSKDNKPDTGSVLGILGENIYNIPITDENIINVDNYDGNVSIGFKVRFIR